MKARLVNSSIYLECLIQPVQKVLSAQETFVSWTKSQDQVRIVKAGMKNLRSHSLVVVMVSYAPKEEGLESQALKKFASNSWSDQMKSQDQVRTVKAGMKKPRSHSLVVVMVSYAPKEEGLESQALKKFASSSWSDQMKSQDQVRTVRASTRKPNNHSLVAVTVSCVPTEEVSEFQAEEKFASRWWSDQMKSQD